MIGFSYPSVHDALTYLPVLDVGETGLVQGRPTLVVRVKGVKTFKALDGTNVSVDRPMPDGRRYVSTHAKNPAISVLEAK